MPILSLLFAAAVLSSPAGHFDKHKAPGVSSKNGKATSARAGKPVSPAIKSSIQKGYDGIIVGIKKQDLSKTMSYFAKDYTWIGRDQKKHDVKELRDNLTQQFRQFRLTYTSYTASIKEISVGKGIVNSKVSISYKAKPADTKEHETFDRTTVYQDVWAQTGKDWKLKSRKVLSVNMSGGSRTRAGLVTAH